MNDQMYKQNRRVMDERLGRGGVGRVGRKQSLSLASSSGPETGMELERPGCRIVCRVLLQFVFSQASLASTITVACSSTHSPPGQLCVKTAIWGSKTGSKAARHKTVQFLVALASQEVALSLTHSFTHSRYEILQ